MGVVYIIILIIHLFAIQASDESLAMVTKPMLMLALLMFFAERTKQKEPGIKSFVILALLFSLAGDVLLMFQHKHTQFFILGLSAFLAAHIFYILCFRRIRKQNQAAPDAVKRISAVLAIAYAGLLLAALFPRLGAMTVPVFVYGLVICLMLVSALFAFRGFSKGFEQLSILGAVLFVASDSILAINKFHTPFPEAGFLIMLTYGLAQFFIVWGSIRYLKQPVVG